VPLRVGYEYEQAASFRRERATVPSRHFDPGGPRTQPHADRCPAYAHMPMSGQPPSRMPDDGRVLTPEVAAFGDQVTEALARTLGTDLVGVYFVGSAALGG